MLMRQGACDSSGPIVCPHLVPACRCLYPPVPLNQMPEVSLRPVCQVTGWVIDPLGNSNVDPIPTCGGGSWSHALSPPLCDEGAMQGRVATRECELALDTPRARGARGRALRIDPGGNVTVTERVRF